MTKAPSPARSAQRYVDLALERGGGDNATAVVVKVVEAGETKLPLEQQQRDEAVLAESALLRDLTPQQRLRAMRITTPRELEAGRAISPVALADRVAYLLLEGSATTASGVVVRAGELIFPQALLEGSAAGESARATTAVRLLVIRRDDFLELTDDDADLGVALFASVARIIAPT
jgi:CRP-like cAMP-binding protein